MTKSPRKRVLLMAFSCAPGVGSEPGVGWNRAVETAKYFDTWVLCKTEFEDLRRRCLANTGPIPGLSFVEVGKTDFERLLEPPPAPVTCPTICGITGRWPLLDGFTSR